jgi:predicted nucleotidyltransferase component of viral defense system
MMLSHGALLREAAATGFQAEPLEKAARLLQILESIRSHPFLKNRLALKGGTALNLFLFDVPRLSVDVDLNYTGASDRETMLLERPQVEQALQAVFGRLGLRVRRVPTEHAGGKWRLSYETLSGRPGSLEVDLNFLMRTPLWPCQVRDSRAVGPFRATAIPVLDIHELAGGKLAALFGRNASRDLFDVRNLLRDPGLDHQCLRLAFVVYGGCSRRDWRTISLDDARADPVDVERQLIPMLRNQVGPDHLIGPGRSGIAAWSQELEAECRELLAGVLPLSDEEVAFLSLLNDQGEIAPDRLAQDAEMKAIIRGHPGLHWKALNVRERMKRGG